MGGQAVAAVSTVIHIEQKRPAPATVYIPPDTSWPQLMKLLGCESRFEFVPDPVYPYPLHEYKVACEVDALMDEYSRADDLPAPMHFADECSICEALVAAEELLP